MCAAPAIAANDDEREKARRRKSLAASSAKRKSMLLARPPLGSIPLDLNEKAGDAKSAKQPGGAAAAANMKKQLTNEGLADLYTQCIKLATSNKVTVKNAFELDLIDYIPDVLSMADADAPDIEIGVGADGENGASGNGEAAGEAVVVKRRAQPRGGEDTLTTNFQVSSSVTHPLPLLLLITRSV